MKASTAALILVVVAGGGWLAFSQLGGNTTNDASSASLMTVEPSRLRVDVSTSATIYAAKSEVVRSAIEGRATILWLADEGKTVKKGDKLVELDVSSLRDKSENQAISVSRAKAAMITAQKNLEIQKNQNASDIESARNDVLFAQLELEKFLGREEMRRRGGVVSDQISKTVMPNGGRATDASSTNGEEEIKMGVRKQELVSARADIEIAQEEVKRAQNRLKWTKELHADKYVTDNDLEADELSLKKAEKGLTLAKNRAHILESYTLLKNERELMALVKEAKAEERRTELRCEARIAQEEADVSAKVQEYDLAKAIFDKLNTQIAASTLRAPADGLVVYATVGDRRRREPIDLGTDVREGQEIIKLPDVTTMRLKASVAESVVSKVAEGQRVEIKVQTVQDKIFYGEVTRVAKVHDSNNSWFSDTKEYRTEMAVFGSHPELREGVSAIATIKVADLVDVLTVPVQAIQRAEQVLYVWVQGPNGPEERMIEKGMSNERRVEVKKGLASGDRVWLSTPPGVTAPRFEEENARIKAEEEKRKTKLEEEAAERQKQSAAAARRRGETGAPSQTRKEGEENSSRRGGNSDRRAKFTALMEEIKKRFPEDAAKLSNPMGLFRDPEMRAKVENDPVVGPKWKEMMSGFRGRRGGGEGRGGEGRGGHEGRGNRGGENRGSRGGEGRGGRSGRGGRRDG